MTERIAQQSEYVARRLAGRPARFAGDVMLAAQTRSFGLVYDDLPGQAGLRAAEALEKELRRAGVELRASMAFSGGTTAPAARSADAGRVVSRLRQAGVTSVLYVGDALFPLFMTQEATRQGYGPEWVLLGTSAGGGPPGADTTFSGRTYDQTQWAHAFGLSFSAARLAPGQGDAWRIHSWHTAHAPPAGASHARIFRAPWIFFTGMRLGGPAVTPLTIRDGLSRLPPRPAGGWSRARRCRSVATASGPATTTAPATTSPSCGGTPPPRAPTKPADGAWGCTATPTAGSATSPGTSRRPTPRAFDRSGSVTVYDEPPPSDRPPSYQHQA